MCEKVCDGFAVVVIVLSFTLGVVAVLPAAAHYVVKKGGLFRE